MISPMAALSAGQFTPKKAKAKAKGASASKSKTGAASGGTMLTLPATPNAKDEKEIRKLAKSLDTLFAEADVALDISSQTDLENDTVQGLRFRCQVASQINV